MDKNTCSPKLNICFLYPIGKGDSGQRRATELIIESLGKDKINSTVVAVPVLDRSDGFFFLALLRYVWSLLAAWGYYLISIRHWTIMHWTIGQTNQALIRDSFPVSICRLLKRPIVTSIHGSNFMEWNREKGLGVRFFSQLKRCAAVTVLGEKQRKHLLNQELSDSQVIVVPNCCEFDPISETDLMEKLSQSLNRPINLLFLSSLIDSKGYPLFVEAVEAISQHEDIELNVVLCGRLTGSQFASRFASLLDAENWLCDKIESINRSLRVKITWIRGAWGEDKKALFEAADIFCLPTTYKVEAQPLVLLEAASQGCALISSRVGEIPSTFEAAECLFLEKASVDNVVEAIQRLIVNRDKRCKLARAAWMRYKSNYTMARYSDNWAEVFTHLDSR